MTTALVLNCTLRRTPSRSQTQDITDKAMLHARHRQADAEPGRHVVRSIGDVTHLANLEENI